MNYDGCYDGLLEFLRRDMVGYGAFVENEFVLYWIVCDMNE